jgi:hypothetical protein
MLHKQHSKEWLMVCYDDQCHSGIIVSWISHLVNK